jgi:superfamily I DNA/RNA helicase
MKLLENIKKKWKVLQILSEQENINLFERIVNEREIKMKTIQELLALKRELEVSINKCQTDEAWQSMVDYPDTRIKVLKTRLLFISNIIDNFGLYDWIFNSNTQAKRTEIVNPSNIEIIDAQQAAELSASSF